MTDTNTTINTGDTPTLSPRARARQVKRDRGVCYDCSNPAIPGQARCDKCATRARERQKVYDYGRSRKRKYKESKGEVMSKDRDFFAEGVDAYMSGHSDLPPSDVSKFGPNAETEWICGYESVDDKYVDDDAEC